MLGTWQPTRGAEVADRELADGERLEDAQALGVGQRATDGGVPLAIGLGETGR